MNKRYFSLLTVFVSAASLTAFDFLPASGSKRYETYDHRLFSSGPPAGRTGAPGEGNCTSCHAGSVLDGTVQNSLAVTLNNDTVQAYLPSTTYTIRVSIATSPSAKGFQSTVLNGSNQFSGSFTALPTTSIISGNGRFYANHKLSSTTPGTTTWEWEWTSPPADQGPVTFYLSTNEANGNGQSSGDKIYLSQHTLGSVLGVKESASLSAFAMTSDAQGKIRYRLSSRMAGRLDLFIYDLHGKEVASHRFATASEGTNEGTFQLKDPLPAGMYIVHALVENNAVSTKLLIP